MTEDGKNFLNNEFLMLSINGGFQRNSIYNGKSVKEKDRKLFRGFIKEEVHSLYIKSYKSKAVTGCDHVQNLWELKGRIEKEHSGFLKNEEITLGTVQKVVNLYLKYQWCVGDSGHTPPHCPIDAIIIEELGLKGKEKVSWTKLSDKASYLNLINKIKEKAVDEPIAEWELRVFSRVGDI
jgi:hypothetical protein